VQKAAASAGACARRRSLCVGAVRRARRRVLCFVTRSGFRVSRQESRGAGLRGRSLGIRGADVGWLRLSCLAIWGVRDAHGAGLL